MTKAKYRVNSSGNVSHTVDEILELPHREIIKLTDELKYYKAKMYIKYLSLTFIEKANNDITNNKKINYINHNVI